MIQDTLNELERMLEKEIQKITNKNDITPTELESMTKTLCLLEHIQGYRDGGYSGYIYDPNQPMMDGRSYAPLIDFESKAFWLKTTDVNGVPQQMRRFNFEEYIPQPAVTDQPVSRKEFDELRKSIKELKELLE